MNSAQLLEHFDRISEAPDAVARLRRFILDLAVRGKLVEQDPGDEPAAELLKRIQAEKARLMKEGKIKELKALAPITANRPYELPATWQWIPLGVAVNSHLGGGTPSKNNSAYWDGEIYWASVKDIGKGKYVDETIDQITEAGLADSSSNLIPPGNLIVVTRMGLGKISINRVPIAINQDLRALSLSSLAAIDYYYNFFKTHGFEGSGLTVKGIKVEELLNIPFPLPPLAEQHRIIAKVDELMALCDQLEAAKNEREARRDRLVAASLNRIGTAPAAADESALEDHSAAPLRDAARFHLDHLPRLTTRPEHIKQLRQTILNLAVRGRLVPQDPKDEPALELLNRIQAEKARLIKEKKLRKSKTLEELGENEISFSLPPLWTASRLGVFYDVRDGTHDTPKYVDVGYPLITSKNLSSGRLTFDDVKFISKKDHQQISERSLVERNDVLLAMIGSIGNPVIVDTDRAFSIKNVALFKHYDSSGSDPNFLCLFLQNAAGVMRNLAAGGLQPFVSLGFLRNYPIALPPLAEQHRIVAKVDELMALCDQLEAQLTATQTDTRRLLEAVLHEALHSSAVVAG